MFSFLENSLDIHSVIVITRIHTHDLIRLGWHQLFFNKQIQICNKDMLDRKYMSASVISAQFLYKVSNALANVLDAPYVIWVSHIVYDIGR